MDFTLFEGEITEERDNYFDFSYPLQSKRPRIGNNDSPNGWYQHQLSAYEKAAMDDLLTLKLGFHQSIGCSLQLGLNWNQKSSTADVSTDLCLGLADSTEGIWNGRDSEFFGEKIRVTPLLSNFIEDSQHYCHAGTASTSQDFLSVGWDLRAQCARLDEEMTSIMKEKVDQIIRENTRIRKQQTISLENSIRRLFEGKIAAKNLELEEMNKKNRELVNKVMEAEDEVDKIRFQVWQSDEELNYLQAELKKIRGICGENDASSHVSGGVEDTSVKKCYICQRDEARILHLPCRHLSVCGGCDKKTDVCPVCFLRKTESIEVIFP